MAVNLHTKTPHFERQHAARSHRSVQDATDPDRTENARTKVDFTGCHYDTPGQGGSVTATNLAISLAQEVPNQ